jgi:ABC-type transporter Mla subunit MlaD
VARSGNGIDIGMVYELLTQVSARLDSHDSKLDQLLAVVNGHSRILSDHSRILADHSRILADHSRILADHSRQLDDLKASMTELRAAVGDYHGAVVSQGIHYSELEGRILRVERHLKLDPTGG